MAIDKSDNVELTVSNAPAEEDRAFISTDYLPKDPSFGKRHIRIAKNILLEKLDTEGITVGEEIVLMRWGVVKITKVDGGLVGDFVPGGDFKAAKRKVSWMANVPEQLPVTLYEFDNLIIKEKLEDGEDFKDFINPDTLATSEVIGDFALKNLQKGDIIQLERRGYYRVDQPYMSEDKGIVLFMIPDGKTKSMGGLTGKLAHR
jgi:glutamyl-tRNA synthetase